MSSASRSSGLGTSVSSSGIKHAWLPTTSHARASHVNGSSGFISASSRSYPDSTHSITVKPGSEGYSSQLIQALRQTVAPLQSTPVMANGEQSIGVEPLTVSTIGAGRSTALLKRTSNTENSNSSLFVICMISFPTLLFYVRVCVCMLLTVKPNNHSM